ncbi:Trm112 family protein [Pontibacter russatus]|uniref:Trm112 family protein n=1 Tax=Pontibacter russatus TaxID=2694929 RepID=UPI001379D011|nr:Trm112 family protein [Pontibacter russatus]
MNPSLLNKLCCPLDKQELESKVFVQHENGDIIEGLLTCPACRRYYPIIYGIPILTPDEYREKALEEPILKKWGLALTESGAGSFLLKA